MAIVDDSTNISWSYQQLSKFYSNYSQKLSIMVVIELHFVVVLTLQSGGYILTKMGLSMLCYFNRSLKFISAHTFIE